MDNINDLQAQLDLLEQENNQRNSLIAKIEEAMKLKASLKEKESLLLELSAKKDEISSVQKTAILWMENVRQMNVESTNLILVDDPLLKRRGYNPEVSVHSLDDRPKMSICGRSLEIVFLDSAKDPNLLWANEIEDYSDNYDIMFHGVTIDLKCHIEEGKSNSTYPSGSIFKLEKFNNLANIIIQYEFQQKDGIMYYKFIGWFTKEDAQAALANFKATDSRKLACPVRGGIKITRAVMRSFSELSYFLSTAKKRDIL